MSQSFDANRSLTALDQHSTIIAVIEMSQSSWLVAALVPGVKRQPLKKLDVDKDVLLKLLHRWRDEAGRAGHPIKRIVVAYEAGRDGFWLARWLRRQEVEAYVIHSTSVAVSREHRRAKTDRLDTELLMRAFVGWLRGEKRHCSMAAIPTAEEEDARRPNRERENLVTEQTRIVNQIKSILTRFGIRSFRPTLRKAADKLDGLRTAEGMSLLENARAELHPSPGSGWSATRSARSSRNACASLRRCLLKTKVRPRWFACWRGSPALASRRRICWSMRCFRAPCAIAGPSPAMPGSPAHRTRAAGVDARKVLRAPVTRASGAA